jgi:hypothetical protein
LRKRFASPRIGLIKAGPYDAEFHRSDDIYVGLITGSSIAHNSKKFIQHLERGHNYYRGFRSIFKVNRFVFSDEYVKIVEDRYSNNVLQYIENAYFELAERLPDKSVIMVAVDDEILEKSYARIKALRFNYTKKTIRLQIIKRSTLEKALSDDTTLNFTLLNMATTIYAKVGSVPWVLETQLIPAGIFIGIAFTRPKIESSINKVKEAFFYGILTVYNKFGKYINMTARGIRIKLNDKIKGIKSLYIPKGDMIQMLSQIINTYSSPAVIVHKSARFHTDEIEAVRQVLGSKGTSYALVHIESSNPYRGYGECMYDDTVVRGDLVLDKELKYRAILFTTGCMQSEQGIQKKDKPGTPRPLELEVEENTTPYSVRDFSNQVLGLTKLDWNTTDLEIRTPITIKYARKVATLTQYLSSTIMDIRDLM